MRACIMFFVFRLDCFGRFVMPTLDFLYKYAENRLCEETGCSLAGNRLFHIGETGCFLYMKQSVSSGETKCFVYMQHVTMCRIACCNARHCRLRGR